MTRHRDTIKYCLDDYLAVLSPEEKAEYLLANTALIAIIHAGATDEKIFSEAKRFDEENGTDLFSQVIAFRVYCAACHKFNCTC